MHVDYLLSHSVEPHPPTLSPELGLPLAPEHAPEQLLLTPLQLAQGCRQR
jgi:hypothetical protein